jgi:hypothetical protein
MPGFRTVGELEDLNEKERSYDETSLRIERYLA